MRSKLKASGLPLYSLSAFSSSVTNRLTLIQHLNSLAQRPYAVSMSCLMIASVKRLTTSNVAFAIFLASLGSPSTLVDSSLPARPAISVCGIGGFAINVVRLGMPNVEAEPPPTRDVNRDSGTDSANGGWLRRLVRQRSHNISSAVYPLLNLRSNLRVSAAHGGTVTAWLAN